MPSNQSSSPLAAVTLSRLPSALCKHINPITIISTLWTYRDLIKQFTQREIEGRYKGSHLGIVWSFITPLVMLAVYTFVFGVVFKARWPGERGNDSLAEFAVIMFAGQVSFQLFAEPVGRAAGIIVSVPNFVKKVVFPLQILPVAILGGALYHTGIGLLICTVASLAVYGSIPLTALITPLTLIPLALLALGLTWFLASLGVYLRDIGYLITVILQFLFFATPIFYPITSIPEQFRPWMAINPLTPMINLVRGSLILGNPGDLTTWAQALGFGILAAILGYAWFMLTRRGFSDVV